MPSLLVTNDFPPKLGGIQSYLYELWRRLPPEETTVLTTPYAGAADVGRAAGVPGRARPAEGVAAVGARWPATSTRSRGRSAPT